MEHMSSMAASNDGEGGGKRRRTCGGGLRLADLPNEALAKVAGYLPLPSAALFASALTAPSSSWRVCNWARRPSATSEAIIAALSSNDAWEIVDLVDVDKHLAKKLSDGDLGALLACIDAKRRVKRLKLTGCWNIVGHGLEPLRGSVALQQIDLSMVKEHQDPCIGHELSICEQAVLPILESIVDGPGNSLRQMQFPENWIDSSSNRPLHLFFERYNSLLGSRPFNCAGNKEDCIGCAGELPWIDTDDGLQKFTCYGCLRNFCTRCHVSSSCRVCGKFYCRECAPSMRCDQLKRTEWGEEEWYQCRAVQCVDCEEMIRCKYCSLAFCFNCCDGMFSDIVPDSCQHCIYERHGM